MFKFVCNHLKVRIIVFVAQNERFLFSYSPADSTMFLQKPRRDKTNTSSGLSYFFVVTKGSPTGLEREDERRDIQLIAVYNLTTRCH